VETMERLRSGGGSISINYMFESYLDRLQQEGVLYLNIKVIPKAQKTEVVEVLEGPEGEKIVKVKVAAVPEKGKANVELCRYMAEEFGVSKSSVSVVRGNASQRKVLKILNEGYEILSDSLRNC